MNLNRLFWVLANVAAIMLALGFLLPYVIAFFAKDFNLPVVVWNVLQLGGIGGLLVFYLAYRLTKPKTT